MITVTERALSQRVNRLLKKNGGKQVLKRSRGLGWYLLSTDKPEVAPIDLSALASEMRVIQEHEHLVPWKYHLTDPDWVGDASTELAEHLDVHDIEQLAGSFRLDLQLLEFTSSAVLYDGRVIAEVTNTKQRSCQWNVQRQPRDVITATSPRQTVLPRR
jgi:hypothetical protein